MALAAVLGVIYSLKQVVEDGLAVLPVLAIVAGVVIGVVFVRWQRTLAHPLLDLELFSERTFPRCPDTRDEKRSHNGTW